MITRYVYDAAGNLIAEADASNAITRYYVYGAAGLMAMITPTGEIYNYHYNAIGNTIAMTDQSQNMVNKYAYTPFGRIANEEETIQQPFKFVGQHGVMIEPDGFYYMRARYYDPQIQRFISEDPIGFAGGDVNLYAYVQNNPIMFVDPSGLRWFGGGDDGWSLGRPGTIIPPGGTVGAALEAYGPAMETMSNIHDPLVGALVPELGDGKVATALEKAVDFAVNIPTMPVAYATAVVYETANSVAGAVTGIYNFLTGGTGGGCDNK